MCMNDRATGRDFTTPYRQRRWFLGLVLCCLTLLSNRFAETAHGGEFDAAYHPTRILVVFQPNVGKTGTQNRTQNWQNWGAKLGQSPISGVRVLRVAPPRPKSEQPRLRITSERPRHIAVNVARGGGH